jgi:hypothetical protein
MEKTLQSLIESDNPDILGSIDKLTEGKMGDSSLPSNVKMLVDKLRDAVSTLSPGKRLSLAEDIADMLGYGDVFSKYDSQILADIRKAGPEETDYSKYGFRKMNARDFDAWPGATKNSWIFDGYAGTWIIGQSEDNRNDTILSLNSYDEKTNNAYSGEWRDQEVGRTAPKVKTLDEKLKEFVEEADWGGFQQAVEEADGTYIEY